jgi:hypothetical protein
MPGRASTDGYVGAALVALALAACGSHDTATSPPPAAVHDDAATPAALPVALPRLDGSRTIPLPSEGRFVVIAPDGAVRFGRRTKTSTDFHVEANAAAGSDLGPPPERDDTSADDGPQPGPRMEPEQGKMGRKIDPREELRARQAIEDDDDDDDARGGPQVRGAAIEPVDPILVLADAHAPASAVLGAVARSSGYMEPIAFAVDAGAGPACLPVRFGGPWQEIEFPRPVDGDPLFVDLGADGVAVRRPYGGAAGSAGWRGGRVDRTALAAAYQAAHGPAHRAHGATVTIDDATTAAELIDVVDAVTAAGATTIVIRQGRTPPITGAHVRIGAVSSGHYSTGDARAVGAVLGAHRDALMACYAASKAPSGSMTLELELRADGTVARAAADGLDKAVATCVTNAVRALPFPKVHDGATLTYPLAFSR